MFKHLFASLAVLAGAALCTHADQEPKLLLHYNFSADSVSGNTVKDASGNGYNGTVSGLAKIGPIPASERRQGLDNTASKMGDAGANTGGSIRYSGKGPGKLKSFTIAMWYRADQQPVVQGTRLFDFSGIRSPFLLGFNSDKGNLAFNVGNQTLMINRTVRPVVNAKDEWAFIAIVFDGQHNVDNLRMFAYFGDSAQTNGQYGSWSGTSVIHPISAASLDRTEWDFSGEKANLVFAANPNNGRAFSGSISDIFIFGSADDEYGALDHIQLRDLVDKTNPNKRR